MEVTGTLVNYYIHCKRQCYLFGNKINLEDNEELVKIGKALHEERLNDKINSEIEINNIKIDKLSNDYLTEIKKSDSDEEASKWQLIYYLYKLKELGIYRKGKLDFIEKKNIGKTIIIELTEDLEKRMNEIIFEIEELLSKDEPPDTKLKISKCKKCAYYTYCYI
ncbi:CRISPR-associated protein Cas4 [Tissierella creatinini]|nr:CRISPR-associated protein Cas4 [Tissierella creatinini]TJX64601.1 CRISPR-associated protein Cas4 [Soehngenia saccharolytica]